MNPKDSAHKKNALAKLLNRFEFLLFVNKCVTFLGDVAFILL